MYVIEHRKSGRIPSTRAKTATRAWRILFGTMHSNPGRNERSWAEARAYFESLGFRITREPEPQAH